jgi:chorismate-pyruvate lyase
MITQPATTDAELLEPLAELHTRAGRPLPRASIIAPQAIPEPYRTLLVHERDMTRTLEQFHRHPIHLEVLKRLQDGPDTYWREVVLRLDGSNQPVEFGAIQIHLTQFPEPWRTQVLEERLPLGAILNASHINYTSRPRAYLRFECDDFIRELFGLESNPLLYGRRNTLRNAAGDSLAEIIEILPPT